MNECYCKFMNEGMYYHYVHIFNASYLDPDDVDIVYSDNNMVELRNYIEWWVEEYADE